MAIQAVAQEHPVETWSALIGSLVAIGGLIGVLYKRLNDDIKENDIKLDNGVKQFTLIGEKLVAIGEKLQNIGTDENAINDELDRITTDIKDLEKRLTIIETEHKRCIAIVMESNHSR